MTIPSLQKPIQLLFAGFLFFAGAYYAKGFLVPVVIAALFATLLMPLCRKMEARGLPRGLAVTICVLSLLAVVAGIVALLVWQVSDLAKDATNIEQTLTEKLSQLRNYVDETFGISRKQQKEIVNSGQPSGRLPGMISGFLAGLGGFLTDTVLMLVYLFLFLYLRTHLKQSVLKLAPAAKKEQATRILTESCKVSQKYLAGMAMMIGCLWVLYGIGFSIVGVKNAIFFAILCGLLEIVPFVGNLTGTLFTVVTVFAQGGGSTMVLGVLVTYAIIQFVQTYLLEPLIVGAEVSINPLTTIAGLVVGELVWGIPGMVLAIPLIGVFKIVCDNVEPWRPVGFLLGSPPKKEKKKNN
jgi:predicted PurR-regulated permease PerM